MRKILFLALSVLTLFSCNRRDDSSGINAINKDTCVGLDISQNQGKMNFDKLLTESDITFLIIRATCGKDRKDDKLEYNYGEARRKKVLLGLYHYYDPDENSELQARNYLREARNRLKSGDFFPAVDIEYKSKVQSFDRLRVGLRNWLTIVETELGVKPIIYSGHSYYADNLKKEFSEYPLWVAAYSPKRYRDPLVQSAVIHQFSKKLWFPGIPKRYKVDGNKIPKDKLASILIP